MKSPEQRRIRLCRILQLFQVPGSKLLAGLLVAALFSVSAYAGSTPKVTLLWTASSGTPPASGYNVYRGTTSGTYPTGWQRVNIGLVLGTSFVDNVGLQNGTYYYVATAVNTDAATCSTQDCESGPSNQVTAVVKWPKPPTIGGQFK